MFDSDKLRMGLQGFELFDYNKFQVRRMSWFMFKQSPQVKPRGIKVDGFQDMHRQRVNLSWGMTEKQKAKAYLEKNTMPLTYQPRKAEPVSEVMKAIKVLTEISEEDEEELMKLIRNRKQSKKQRKDRDYESNVKVRSDKKSQNTEESQFSKRMRYLQNSLLPQYKRDSMGTILDHQLNKSIPLSESRMSSKSLRQNRKNESQIALGDGYNSFKPIPQEERDHSRQLKEMYDYEDKYKERVAKSHIIMG